MNFVTVFAEKKEYESFSHCAQLVFCVLVIREGGS